MSLIALNRMLASLISLMEASCEIIKDEGYLIFLVLKRSQILDNGNSSGASCFLKVVKAFIA